MEKLSKIVSINKQEESEVQMGSLCITDKELRINSQRRNTVDFVTMYNGVWD